MAVTWPDGSVTGSVRVTPAPTPAEPEPAKDSPETAKKKEASDGNR